MPPKSKPTSTSTSTNSRKSSSSISATTAGRGRGGRGGRGGGPVGTSSKPQPDPVSPSPDPTVDVDVDIDLDLLQPTPPPPAQSETETTNIPPHLLSRILHEFFSSSSSATASQTRISNAAVNAIAEYTRTFVREAIYRAVDARVKEEAGSGEGGAGRVVVQQVEVKDLEKVGPQLVLDF